MNKGAARAGRGGFNSSQGMPDSAHGPSQTPSFLMGANNYLAISDMELVAMTRLGDWRPAHRLDRARAADSSLSTQKDQQIKSRTFLSTRRMATGGRTPRVS